MGFAQGRSSPTGGRRQGAFLLIRNEFSSPEKSLAICSQRFFAPLQRFPMFVACLRRHSAVHTAPPRLDKVQSVCNYVFKLRKVYRICRAACSFGCAGTCVPERASVGGAAHVAAVYANLFRCSITLSRTIEKLWRRCVRRTVSIA